MKKLINFKDHMKNENYLKVDYDDLVKNYNNQLVTKLRDFGDNLLDLWVQMMIFYKFAWFIIFFNPK